MRAINRIAGIMFAVVTVMQAQVGTVTNAAVFQPVNVFANPYYAIPNSYYGLVSNYTASFANTIAPRMLAILSYPAPELISNLGPFSIALPVAATLFIRPVGSNTTIPVTVANAVYGAITFVVPAGVPVGGAELIYQIDNQPSQWTSVNVVQSSFEFFRISPGGPAIAQTIGSNGGLANVGLTTPAQPGQTLFLTGSGLGYGSTVNATIGGVPAPVTYAGAHPTQAGHDEILIPIPAGVADGCYVPVAFTWNQTTVTTTISKTSDGSPCKHPWQLSVNDMKTLDNGGFVTDGIVNLSTELDAVTSTAASRSESADMSLGQINAGGIAAYFTPLLLTSGPSCTALAPTGGFVAFNGTIAVLLPQPTVPDIGSSVTLQSPTAAITLTGSDGYYSQNLPTAVDGPLSNLPPPVIAAGKWTWQSSGGKDLPASSFGFTLPTPLQLNGGAPISLRRNQDQTITWNGRAFDAGATVNLFLTGSTGAAVSCTAPAGTGTVTIPASLLSGYSANTIGTITASVSETGPSIPHAQFQLQNGTTLVMLVSYSSTDSRPVAFQ